MKQFETVYKELEELLIRKLPEYIEKINKKYNDNLILKPFENTTLEENCIKQPCFKFSIDNAEYSEKDRIIENTIFQFSYEIKIPSTENELSILWRYIEAINKMLIEEDSDIIILKIQASKIILRITVS